jgi:hypothetical protein
MVRLHIILVCRLRDDFSYLVENTDYGVLNYPFERVPHCGNDYVEITYYAEVSLNPVFESKALMNMQSRFNRSIAYENQPNFNQVLFLGEGLS